MSVSRLGVVEQLSHGCEERVFIVTSHLVGFYITCPGTLGRDSCGCPTSHPRSDPLPHTPSPTRTGCLPATTSIWKVKYENKRLITLFFKCSMFSKRPCLHYECSNRISDSPYWWQKCPHSQGEEKQVITKIILF